MTDDSKELFNKMKSFCLDYMNEMNEESPDYGCITMDIADACTGWLLSTGEITAPEKKQEEENE